MLRANSGEDFPITLCDTAAIGGCYCAANRVADAHQYLATALQSLEAGSRKPQPRSHIAVLQCELGLTLLREGHFAEAEVLLRKSLEEYDRNDMFPLSRTLRPQTRAVSGLGQALAGQGKFEEAEPLLVSACEDMQARERYITCDPAGTIRDAFMAVIAFYTTWAENDPAKKPAADTWRKALEEFEARQAKPADLPAGKI
jgi:tetratricopeptide (TPR) repeat protein